MSRIFTFLMLMGLCITLKAQLVFNENFSGYANGNLNGKGSWTQGGSGTDVQVASATPLTRAGYTSGTQYITVATVNGRDESKNFSANISATGSRVVYASFLVRATSAVSLGDYSFRVWDGSSSLFRFYMERDAQNNLEFTTSVGSGAANFTNGNFTFGATYLIVIRYDIVSGNNNDNVYMWVNPSLATEPGTGTANVSLLSGDNETNYNNLTGVQFQQSTTTATAAFDGFKIATGTTSALAWSNLNPVGAPLPVKLDNFDASKDGNNIKLVWNTSDEIGVKSYDVERSTDGYNFSAIGSVDAQNKKTYSFTDIQPSSDNNFYRLKMVDLDGNYKLSHVVSIRSKAGLTIMLSPNPVKDKLVVLHPKAETGSHLQVVNVDGKILRDIQVPANAVETTIDFSSMRNGMYYVMFTSGTASVSKTILKQ